MGIHKLHLYTGDGKGKTSAAMGLALRALGHGQRVLIAQFLKDGSSGEIRALKTFPGATVAVLKPVSGFLYQMTAEEKERACAAQAEQARLLREKIARERPGTVILDELAEAASLGAVGEAEARQLIETSLRTAETAVTGGIAPEWMEEMSDYISVIGARRHPYRTEGLAAREGVEW